MIRVTKTEPHFKNLYFVTLARATNAKPPNGVINYILSTGDKIIATDGRRLHLYESEFLPAGLYEVIKANKSEIILEETDAYPVTAYPDHTRVMPSPDGAKGFSRAAGEYIKDSGKLAEVMRALPDNSAIDMDYFKDIMTAEMGFYKVTDGHSPVLFLGDNVQAVVMPLKW